MPNESIVCPKCNAAMEAGFILDVTDGSHRPIRWLEGPQEFSFWRGWGDRKKFQVTTYRCVGCGYLESYALPLPAQD